MGTWTNISIMLQMIPKITWWVLWVSSLAHVPCLSTETMGSKSYTAHNTEPQEVPAHIHVHQLSGSRSHLRSTQRRFQSVGRHVPWQHGLREGLWRELGHSRRIVSVHHLCCFWCHLGSSGQRWQRRLVASQEKQGGTPLTSCGKAAGAIQSPDVAVDRASPCGNSKCRNNQAGGEEESQAKHPSWQSEFHCFISPWAFVLKENSH